MNVNNATHRRADIASKSRPFTSGSSTPTPSASTASNLTTDKTLDLAKQHRDRLLTYQSQNARRTHIIDEAADFETPTSGLSSWASPIERAAQLKRQQKVLREQEWNARPEYEKRKVVVSVDLVGGKVIKRMGEVERAKDGDADADADADEVAEDVEKGNWGNEGRVEGGGAFSKNPLMGGLIRPVWKGKGTTTEGREEDKENEPRRNTWRRVQDDEADNEAMILDGGVYGGQDIDGNRRLGDEEHAHG